MLGYHYEAAVFECVADNGSFSHSDIRKRVTVQSKEGFFWRNISDENNGVAFMNILMRLDGDIIGYAVVETYLLEDTLTTYKAKVNQFAVFPKGAGKVQNITIKQGKSLFESAEK